MLANVETLSITYFKLDFGFSTDRIFSQPFSLQFILFDVSEGHISVAGIYACMMRHISDCGSCGQEKVQILRQLVAVVVLVVVHSLAVTKMEPNFSNLVGRTFKMELIWQHSGKFQNK
jgi:hypothetical protein